LGVLFPGSNHPGPNAAVRHICNTGQNVTGQPPTAGAGR